MRMLTRSVSISSLRAALLAGALSLSGSLCAASLEYAGVLGNSGEAGETLVRFAPELAPGMGGFYDRAGTVYDRAGNGRLNRYTLDGRLLDSFTIPKRRPGVRRPDVIARDGETFLLFIEKYFYALPPDHPRDVAPSRLGDAEAEYVSRNLYNGFAAAVNQGEVFRINAQGEIQAVATLPADLRYFGIAQGPKGEIFLILQGHRFAQVDPEAPGGIREPHPSLGNPVQWLNGYWYGFAGHGTAYRISPDFKHDPGVVLGGNSGSFIGYVPGNYELSHPIGIEHLRGDLFSLSGRTGILHLVQWQPADRRFEIVRRIGSIFQCAALSLDDQGRLWWGTGHWEWADLPDTPIRHGMPPMEDFHYAGGSLIQGGIVVSPAIRHRKAVVVSGSLEGPLRSHDIAGEWPKGFSISTVAGKELLVLTAKGEGVRVPIDSKGGANKIAGPTKLQPKEPIEQWTSLTVDGEHLIGTGDGFIIKLQREGDQWQEVERWNAWGTAPDARFGPRLYAHYHDARLWVADTERHRVLCFDDKKLIASYGTTDRAGDDTASLDQPEIITSNQRRAVVYDSKNQRLIKLELKP